MNPRSSRPNEFELIERYLRPLASGQGSFGLADDVAIMPPRPGEDLVLKVDTIAEGVHFFPNDPAEQVAAKALRVNLSDLAAKGAVGRGYLLALSLRADWTEDWVAAFARGLAEDQQTYGVTLLGGDTTRAAGGTTISISAFGVLPMGTIVRRAGARVGDAIFVSGTIGDASLGLRVRLGEINGSAAGTDVDFLFRRYALPEPRTALAPILRRHASASIDISDGLLGDLGSRLPGVGSFEPDRNGGGAAFASGAADRRRRSQQPCAGCSPAGTTMRCWRLFPRRQLTLSCAMPPKPACR